jgi:hypothetical protein
MPTILTSPTIASSDRDVFVAKNKALYRQPETVRKEGEAEARVTANRIASDEARADATHNENSLRLFETDSAAYGTTPDHSIHEGLKVKAANSATTARIASEVVMEALVNRNGWETIRRRIDRYIDQLMRGTAAFRPAPEIVLTDTVQVVHANACKAIRDRIKKRGAIWSAPVPFDDALADIKAEIDRKAAEHSIRTTVNEKGATILWPTVRVNAAPDGFHDLPEAPDPWPLIAKVHGDVLLAEAERQLRRKYEGGRLSLSASAKVAALMEVDDELLDAQRLLAAAIWAGEEQGVHLSWPRDTYIDPRAALQIIAPKPLLTREEKEDLEGL